MIWIILGIGIVLVLWAWAMCRAAARHGDTKAGKPSWACEDFGKPGHDAMDCDKCDDNYIKWIYRRNW